MPAFLRKALLLAAIGPAAFAADSTSVSMGGVVALPLAADAGRVTIGNPAVADVTMQTPRSLVLFGKAPGGTTLLVTDRAGKTLLKTSVMVTAADAEGVTIRYGTGKNWSPGGTVASAACGPDRCAPAVPLSHSGNASAAPAAPSQPQPQPIGH